MKAMKSGPKIWGIWEVDERLNTSSGKILIYLKVCSSSFQDLANTPVVKIRDSESWAAMGEGKCFFKGFFPWLIVS